MCASEFVPILAKTTIGIRRTGITNERANITMLMTKIIATKK